MKKNRSKKMQRGGILGFFEDDKPAPTYAPASTTSFWSSIKNKIPNTSSWSLFGDSENKAQMPAQMPAPVSATSYGGKKRPRNKTKKRKTRRNRTRRY